ncbi:hypothetical protein B3C1_02240 [Gallaecimonas xiamenensis 3-C-1]|uniref:Uncharacterized protein n=1 Tax=Gallaecimonas xiamenensis 3-C-1 TaxID=745411 RepID=K2JQM6_9GAMM|nr:hypothetical protein B3C1_02240 [Gallaecimonas xiamenensis 3-C-1]
MGPIVAQYQARGNAEGVGPPPFDDVGLQENPNSAFGLVKSVQAVRLLLAGRLVAGLSREDWHGGGKEVTAPISASDAVLLDGEGRPLCLVPGQVLEKRFVLDYGHGRPFQPLACGFRPDRKAYQRKYLAVRPA